MSANSVVGTWAENGKLVFSELDRLSGEVSKNTDCIGTLTTRVAVIWLKVSMLGAAAGVGGGAGTLIGKLLLEAAKAPALPPVP